MHPPLCEDIEGTDSHSYLWYAAILHGAVTASVQRKQAKQGKQFVPVSSSMPISD